MSANRQCKTYHEVFFQPVALYLNVFLCIHFRKIIDLSVHRDNVDSTNIITVKQSLCITWSGKPFSVVSKVTTNKKIMHVNSKHFIFAKANSLKKTRIT